MGKWNLRVIFIIALIVIVLSLTTTVLIISKSTKTSSTTASTTSPAHCNSLAYPEYTINSLPASWSYESCILGANPSTTPEMYYTISGPYGSNFIVDATISAPYAISIQLVHSDSLEPEDGTALPMNSNNTDWKVSITPCYGTVTCSIDVINNATQDNIVTMNIQAS